MPRKTDPTDPELLAMVEHIRYDLTQLIEVSKLRPRGPAQTVQDNANVEAALMYARKLLTFLDAPEKSKWRDGDVYALDYNIDWKIPPSWWEHTNRDVMNAISTRAAHIHLDRLDKLEWNVDAIAGSITEAMLDFIRSLDKPYESAFMNLPSPDA